MLQSPPSQPWRQCSIPCTQYLHNIHLRDLQTIAMCLLCPVWTIHLSCRKPTAGHSIFSLCVSSLVANKARATGRFLVPNMLAQRFSKCRHLFALSGVQVACAIFHTWKELCCYLLLLHIRFWAVSKVWSCIRLSSFNSYGAWRSWTSEEEGVTKAVATTCLQLKLASTTNLNFPISYHSKFWASTMPMHDNKVEASALGWPSVCTKHVVVPRHDELSRPLHGANRFRGRHLTSFNLKAASSLSASLLWFGSVINSIVFALKGNLDEVAELQV